MVSTIGTVNVSSCLSYDLNERCSTFASSSSKLIARLNESSNSNLWSDTPYWFIIRPTTAQNYMEPNVYQPSEIGIRIHPTHITQYSVRDRSTRGRSKDQLQAQLNLRVNSPKGSVSYKASKRIKNAVNWLVASSQPKPVYSKIDERHFQFRLNLITLTLPSLDLDLTDHQFKNKLLRSWIKRMSYSHGLRNYVWKVETQANGNIHAHITSDCFIHHREIRDAWNSILIKNGLMKGFADKHNHSNPNSTDVKSVKNVKSLSAYLAKYFSKDDDDRRKVSGRLWASSYSLSDRNVCNIVVPPDDDSNIIRPLIDCSAEHFVVEGPKNSMGFRSKLATVFFMKPSVWRELRGTVIYEHFTNRIREIRTGKPHTTENTLLFNTLKHVRFNAKPSTDGAYRASGDIQTSDQRPTPAAERFGIPRNPLSQLDLFQNLS